MLPRAHAVIFTFALIVPTLAAQSPTTVPRPASVKATTDTTTTPAPTLSEVHELKRQTIVLRSNLLQVQREALTLQLQNESKAIEAAIADLRASIEAAHAGWTLGADGAMTQKVSAPPAPPTP